MANRFPLIVDSSSQSIKELPDGDSLLLGDNEKLILGDGTDLQLYHDGSNSYLANSTGALKLATETSGIAITIGHTTSEVTIADNLTVTGTLTLGSGAELAEAELEMLDGITAGTVAASKAVVVDANKDIGSFRNITLTGNINLGDDDEVRLGASSDFKIYHDNGGFNQIIAANDHPIQIKSSSENMLKAVPNGAVELYYNNVLAINTTTTGATTTGLHTSTQSANITQVAITSSSNAVAWDARAAANAYHVTTENTTFSAPSNATEGAIISVEIAQGGTARTVAWNTVFEFAASTAPVVTATANKTDIFAFRYNGAVWQEIGRVQNMAQT